MKKNLFFRFCLILVVGFSAFSCRTDQFPEAETFNNGTKFQLTSKRISLDESKHKAKLLPELEKAEAKFKAFSGTNAQGKIVNYGNGVSIDTESVIYIENGPNYHTYTFHITKANASADAPVENLVLTPLPDGTYKELLVTYHLTPAEKQQAENGIPINTQGKVQITELEKGTYNNGNLQGKEITGITCGWKEEVQFTTCSDNVHSNGELPTEMGGSCHAAITSQYYTVAVYKCDWIYGEGNPFNAAGPGESIGNPVGTPGGGGGSTSGSCSENGIFTAPIDPTTNINMECAPGVPTQINIDDEIEEATPCETFKKNDSIPKIKNKIDSLRNLVMKTPPETTETLVTIKKSFENYIASVSNEQHSSGVGTIGVIGQMTDLDVADIHNHPPQNNMPCFSYEDLVSFYDSYTFVKPSRKKLYTSYLVNFNGTTYALRMNDVSALDALFAGLNIGTTNTTAANKKDARDKIFELYKKYGYKKTGTYNQVQSEKIFLSVLNDPKFGGGNSVQIYRKDGDTWGKLKMEKGGAIGKENCP